MSQISRAFLLGYYLKKIRSVKFFFFVCCTSFACSLLLVQLVFREYQPINNKLIQEAIQNVGRDFRYTDIYRSTKHLPENLKYILLWTRRDYAPFSVLEDGQKSFLKNNCSVVNCYVTANRRFFGRNYTNFDAIAFNGRTMKIHDYPRRRSPHQKYIFVNMESSDHYPVCNPRYDGFFNLTATYKLNSDIPLLYILITDKNGEIVGPKPKMRWKEDSRKVVYKHTYGTENKTKAAAWFVSHCRTRSKREDFVKQLEEALYPYGYTVDVYGKCGNLNCPRTKDLDCGKLLKRDYFFYMSLENSFAEDYVTEKLLTALEHNVVPVVYGGADYSRFLPPGSYIDGRKQNMYQLAAILDELTHSPRKYNQFFSWQQHYTYHNPFKENICNICKALNDKNLMEKSTVYNEFRSWWNPSYKTRC